MSAPDSSPSLVAKRFALRVNPVPSIILEYVQSGKSRVRTVKLMDLSVDADVDRLAAKVLASLPRRLDRSGVRCQVKDMVKDLLALHKEAQAAAADDAGGLAGAGGAGTAGAAGAGPGGSAGGDGTGAEVVFSEETDLNIVSPSRLSAAKEIMNVEFEKNRKRPGEDGFVYDVQKEFTPVEASEWDD